MRHASRVAEIPSPTRRAGTAAGKPGLDPRAQPLFTAPDDSRLSEFRLAQIRDLHQRPQQPDLEGPISVDWNHYSLTPALHHKDVVAAVNARENPPASLNQPRQLPARYLFHTANSMTRVPPLPPGSGVSTESQP